MMDWVRFQIAKQILINVLGEDFADRIVPHAMLDDDLGADSLDMIEIQCAMNDLGLEAPDETFRRGATVGDIAALVHEVVAVKPEPMIGLGDLNTLNWNN